MDLTCNFSWSQLQRVTQLQWVIDSSGALNQRPPESRPWLIGDHVGNRLTLSKAPGVTGNPASSPNQAWLTPRTGPSSAGNQGGVTQGKEIVVSWTCCSLSWFMWGWSKAEQVPFWGIPHSFSRFHVPLRITSLTPSCDNHRRRGDALQRDWVVYHGSLSEARVRTFWVEKSKYGKDSSKAQLLCRISCWGARPGLKFSGRVWRGWFRTKEKEDLGLFQRRSCYCNILKGHSEKSICWMLVWVSTTTHSAHQRAHVM